MPPEFPSSSPKPDKLGGSSLLMKHSSPTRMVAQNGTNVFRTHRSCEIQNEGRERQPHHQFLRRTSMGSRGRMPDGIGDCQCAKGQSKEERATNDNRHTH